jgi:SAM-dependent methyltransferase
MPPGTRQISSPRVSLDPAQIRAVNARYHDAAAESYDSKWGIDYGETGGRQVLMKLSKALGHEPGRYRRALEVGAGTGYFTLNLLREGTIESATATDISAGMLRRLASTARDLDLEVETVRTDAEDLPFENERFDLVLGHAVLHHLPSPERALAEFRRVLVPGGTLAFMGEPSRGGDRLAALPKRVGRLAAPAWRLLVGAQLTPDHRPATEGGRGSDADHRPAAGGRRGSGDLDLESRGRDHELERWVDVHVFNARQLRALASDAGFVRIRVTGEELLASAYGWILRSLEADSDPDGVPRAWHEFAFRTYLALQRVDGRLLEPLLPAQLFYNLLLSARKPPA